MAVRTRWVDRTIDSFPDRRQPAAILVTGIDGGHDLNLRQFAADGMVLTGRPIGADGHLLHLTGNLHQVLDDADDAHDNFISAATELARMRALGFDEPSNSRGLAPSLPQDQMLDLKGVGISSIIWCTGYQPDFGWIEADVFDDAGAPTQRRGVCAARGLYFLGLHWMHTFTSGALFGVGKDAAYIADRIAT